MAETERVRTREREPSIRDSYERTVKYLMELRDRAFKRKVVVKHDDQPWEQSRQGYLKFFISRENDTDTVLRDWQVFIHDIHTHSGKHRHQGGLVIYVIEGEGYTEVNDEKFEWEAGDLLLLPITPGGVVHKHYNKRPGENCKWMAFIYRGYTDAIGHFIEQKENSPEFK
ncbi:MAG: cupin domain-containing protein [Chloroflexi bacterium]|nr:cupin domain-containing protein [Chloroflexota bacterium]